MLKFISLSFFYHVKILFQMPDDVSELLPMSFFFFWSSAKGNIQAHVKEI